MAKNLKLTIKNTQIAEAINLGGLKQKLASKKAAAEPQREGATTKPSSAKTSKGEAAEPQKESKEEAPRIRARSKSAFAEPHADKSKSAESEAPAPAEVEEPQKTEGVEFSVEKESELYPRQKTSKELRKEIFGEGEDAPALEEAEEKTVPNILEQEEEHVRTVPPEEKPEPKIMAKPNPYPVKEQTPAQKEFAQHKLGPTGRHIKDLLPPKPAPKPQKEPIREAPNTSAKAQERRTSEKPVEMSAADKAKEKNKLKAKGKGKEDEIPAVSAEEEDKKGKVSKFKEFRDIKPVKRQETLRFDARDRHGLRDSEEEQGWRKRKMGKARYQQEDIVTIRPTSLKIRVPISIKDLAVEMKLKASELVTKLFMQGLVLTLNDLLEDETTIQLLGQEFGCEITIDTSEAERMRITDKTIKEEIQGTPPEMLIIRPPVVAFMGHVDHGKTSLIDAIRKSNRVAGEAGAITQHIGAFRCSTPVGDIAILDTPGHEAFSAMRARGADVTDIVVLVVAGDEGLRQQTMEAIQHAKAAKVTIVVAINKCDKPNFNAENVYRQLAEQDLLPESWGGQTITVNCSAVTGEGIQQLLEMLALQAEVLELRANPAGRARGTVLESELHKGMGSVATVLVQNGTLKKGDAIVFGQLWGRIKTMHNEFKEELQEAGPSTPVEITGLSGLPEAGQEFIVVINEKEARAIAEARLLDVKQSSLLLAKKMSMENLFQQASEVSKKILNIVLRADVQGSLEALKAALLKIESQKAELNIIFTGVGEISESDVQLAAASKAVIIGFHTAIESHADSLVKELGVEVRLHDIIYHAIDDVKVILGGLLDKIAIETDKGKAEVKAVFKSSHYGKIAGCIVTEGTITRNNYVRLIRNDEVIWKGTMASLKRVKEDVREVAKGLECGILLNNFNEVLEGDTIVAYEVTYMTQEL